MRFFIDFDTGDRIRGWVVPDNPLAISRVRVVADGRHLAEVAATDTDETFRRNGWHATGQCTFEIGEAVVPGLAGIPRLEVYDADTNVLVHRRRPAAGLLQSRLCLINTSIQPEDTIQGLLYPFFQQNYFGVSRLNEEVMRCVLGNPTVTSSFISGALVIPRYEGMLAPEFVLTTILIHDPYIEMATRLAWLRARADMAQNPDQSWRLGALAEAARFVADYDFADPRSLRRLFRMLPEPAYHLLYNPLTRQLGTRLPDDRLQPGNSIVAIEILSRVGIVGHRTYFQAFVATLLDQLGIEAEVPQPPPIPAEVQALAERLRGVKGVEEMLVFDVAMSDAVLASISKSWDSTDPDR
ncbi:hypothetical protein [Methylobacterium sp. A54F]